ncbi:hypothetical protein IHE45_02G045000 [Dioscorea alata]|uniref:Uncharacterized protein n=1 Tax=Dioscorea alata TaxID=55571 RepID=A0ACB7WPF7_DIOAL|nr:hypothetical protein IHE45_02G045000 [Dioscorea alata]
MDVGSTNTLYSQVVGQSSGLVSFLTKDLLQKVKLSQPHEHESLREETTKLHKTLMIHEVNISSIRDKIYEVLDLSKIVHDLESEEDDPTISKKRELMKDIKVKKEMKSFLTTTSQRVDEPEKQLMLIREKLQELKDQEKEQKQIISSGKGLLSSTPLIDEVNQSLTDDLMKLKELKGGDNVLQTSSLLSEAQVNLEKGEA